MAEWLFALLNAVLLANVVVLVRSGGSRAVVESGLAQLGDAQSRFERLLLDELHRTREHSDHASTRLRHELGDRMKGANDSTLQILNGMGEGQRKQFEGFSAALGRLVDSNAKSIEGIRFTLEKQLRSRG